MCVCVCSANCYVLDIEHIIFVMHAIGPDRTLEGLCSGGWHIADELMPKLKKKGFLGKFIVPLPTVSIVDLDE